MGYFIVKTIEYDNQLIVVAKSGLEKALFIEHSIHDKLLRRLCEIAMLLKVGIYAISERYQVNRIKCQITPSKNLTRKNRLLDELVEGTTIPHLRNRYKLHGKAYISLIKLLKWLNERRLLEKYGNYVKTKRPLRLEEKIEILLKVF